MADPYNPYLGGLRSRYDDDYGRILERGMGQFSNSNLPDLQIQVIDERTGMLTIRAYDPITSRKSQMSYAIMGEYRSSFSPTPPKQNLMLLLI